MGELNGRVVAVLGRGNEEHRSAAVGCAEAGADVALGTLGKDEQYVFAVQSIANELWSIGVQHFVRVMDAADPTAAPSFADECWDTLGRCDALIVATAPESSAPLEELSADEWDTVFREGATIPFLHLQAFGRLMVRDGGGSMWTSFPVRPDADPAERGARAALTEVVTALNRAWQNKQVRCTLATELSPEAILQDLVHR